MTHIALVLYDPAPDDVVDVVGKRVGGLGNLEPLVLEEGEELSIGDSIEQEQTSIQCSLAKRGTAVAATVRAGNSALHSRRCSFSSLAPILSSDSRWVALCL